MGKKSKRDYIYAPQWDQLKALVEDVFNLEDISVDTRTRRYINARACYLHIAYVYLQGSHEKNAAFVNRDHATSLNALQKVDVYRRWDGFESQWVEAIARAKKEIKSHSRYGRPTFNGSVVDARHIQRLKNLIIKLQNESKTNKRNRAVTPLL